jgi:HK97 family phage major capsid protein
MAEEEVAAAPVVATYDDTELKNEIIRLSNEIDTYQNKVVDEPKLFTSMGDFVQTKLLAEDGEENAKQKMAKFTMSADNTTTGAGVVPDYLSSEYISIIDTTRVFLGKLRSDPIGSAGMSVVYPKNTGSGPTVAAQSSEFDEPSSTVMTIATQTVDLITYAGANRVSQQLIKRSAPSFVDILFRELASQYATVTDAASIAASVTAAGDTAVLADLGASAPATFAAVSAANTAIIAGVRTTANAIFLAPDRWAQLLELVDSDGRPLLVFGANGPSNAQGQSSFGTMQAQYHGLPVYLVPDAATGTCLITNTEFLANLEMSPVQMSVQAVDTLSTDFGIWGLQAPITKQADASSTLTHASWVRFRRVGRRGKLLARRLNQRWMSRRRRRARRSDVRAR